jgi:copper homeostasis protein
MVHLEICCFNVESARRAHAACVDRIELCREMATGGLTPTESDFLTVKHATSMPIHVMVRTPSPTFVLIEQDYEQMEAEIRNFELSGAAGFVFGGLGPDGRIDEHRMRHLVGYAGGRPCTFHRAFDSLKESDMENELEKLIRCGFKAVLTSGGGKTAWDGKHRLKMLVERARGRIDIIVAGRVRSRDVHQLKDIGTNWFHSSAITDDSDEASNGELYALKQELDRW